VINERLQMVVALLLMVSLLLTGAVVCDRGPSSCHTGHTDKHADAADAEHEHAQACASDAPAESHDDQEAAGHGDTCACPCHSPVFAAVTDPDALSAHAEILQASIQERQRQGVLNRIERPPRLI